MILADVSFTTEGVVIVTALLASLVSALVYTHTLLMKSKEDQLAAYKADAEKQLKDEESQKKSYKEIAEEAVAMHESRLDRERAREGKSAIHRVLAVVPEHNSPVTKEQQATADLQTLRARVTAVTRELGLPPREAGPPEEEVDLGAAPPPDQTASPIDKLKADVKELQQGQILTDIAEVKKDTSEIKDKLDPPKDQTTYGG